MKNKAFMDESIRKKVREQVSIGYDLDMATAQIVSRVISDTIGCTLVEERSRVLDIIDQCVKDDDPMDSELNGFANIIKSKIVKGD